MLVCATYHIYHSLVRFVCTGLYLVIRIILQLYALLINLFMITESLKFHTKFDRNIYRQKLSKY